jgi:hypothetical protein
MFKNMKQLKKLNLSFTKANRQVIDTLVDNCKRVEHLNFENCPCIDDNCIEYLCNDPHISQHLKYLNLHNVPLISDQSIEICLLKCSNLKFLNTHGMIQKLTELYNTHLNVDSSQINLDSLELRGFNLEDFFTDSDMVLKEENMEALSLLCPNLKKIHMYGIGPPKNIFDYLNNFNNLTYLIVSNPSGAISFKFGDSLIDLLRSRIGQQLKYLHLVSFHDVNLRSIAKYCKNLNILNIEFIGYYQPVIDKKIFDPIQPPQNLKKISISNSNLKHDQINMNMDLFAKDLKLLMSNCQISHLNLNGLSELDDSFLGDLFDQECLIGHKKLFSTGKLEILELKELNKISFELFNEFLLGMDLLKEVHLINCKLINKADVQRMNQFLRENQYDCKIVWV